MNLLTKDTPKLHVSQMVAADQQRQDMIVHPPAGTTLLDLQRPDYWTHVARLLRPYDRLEVRFADGRGWAELLVRVVEPRAVVVHVLRSEIFCTAAGEPLAEVVVPDGYKVALRGAKGWIITRLSDGEDIPTEQVQKTKEAAAVWLSAYLRKLAA